MLLKFGILLILFGFTPSSAPTAAPGACSDSERFRRTTFFCMSSSIVSTNTVTLAGLWNVTLRFLASAALVDIDRLRCEAGMFSTVLATSRGVLDVLLPLIIC
uniref:Putative secreted protein n=1 Tax=Anopheles triannulatus TaxID=58253 RepID=A0A2M4B786_9DIPT